MKQINRDKLFDQIAQFIESCELQVQDIQRAHEIQSTFEQLAIQLFQLQFQTNFPYRKLCLHRFSDPAAVQKWQDIPAVMTSSFKHATLFCGDAEKEQRAVYYTSGTTTSVPGKHYFKTTALYELASVRTFEWACLPDCKRLPIIILGPTKELFPHSSLGQMFSWTLQEFGSEQSAAFFSPAGLDKPGAAEWLSGQDHRNPVMMLATSLALLEFVEFCEHNGLQFQLPKMSRIIDTGGYKGSSREIQRKELLQRTAACLGVPENWIFNEYGMTEMSSQFYQTVFILDDFGSSEKLGPPWLRSIACDPDSLALLPDGTAGVLRHFDLANVDSVAMLQTEDIGIVRGRKIELLGRDPAAEPRGCSLLADELRMNA